MASLKAFAIAGVITALAPAALAADLLPPPPMLAPAHAPVEVGSGWYLRGDVGVGVLDFDKFEGVNTAPGFIDPPGGYVVEQKAVDDQIFVGIGAGYQFNHWLRADVTAEYRTEAEFRTVESYSYGGPRGYNTVSSNLATVVGLANAYVDLGTWHGVTPFLGAGVGFAHHRLSGLTDVGAGSATGGIGFAPDKSDTKLAWALHAGLGYEVNAALKLELAYRYLNMGSAEAGRLNCGAICPGTLYKYKDIDSHDFKIGMRWLLAPPVVPVHQDAPLIRKY